VTELGIVIDVSDVAKAKAAKPILVTELGIVIDVSDVAKANASESILVTELGIVIDVSPELSKARSPILVTPFGIKTIPEHV
jgi:microsomal dipeptidase-like Zn-dependent dipeptidase